MPADPPLTLLQAQARGVPWIRLVCSKCGRWGDYSVARLLTDFGDVSMIELREILSADCKRRSASNTDDYCGAVIEW